MRSVLRSPAPGLFVNLRAAYTQWGNLSSQDRGRIRSELTRDFGETCAYCQQSCSPPHRSRAESPNEESIDHFRPISRFPDLWLDWPNLIYACHECNQNKGNKWPGIGDSYDEISNRLLSSEDSRYVPVSEYVSPNESVSQRPAQQFFDFDADTGEIVPSEQLDPEEWSVAQRTIWDLELNSKYLRNLRLERLQWLEDELKAISDFNGKVDILLRFMLPRMPFSMFIRACMTRRFPLLSQLIQ